ncbi:NAD(P)/FAD-dependent oxidoreductase [Pelagicoccus sp. SDUM812005]|uniref:FAD-dependent oxidoreductase n=1 Tax=Pelagicoccus sp. SDUM812005 TaxID=3041257 RepID=UPI00280FDEA6|nr:NAD(P)/FAD-dependent oxidoreductase [Pelagicoccus sp. SDUM812005]MDQ8180168.1 NAD(P)/FAD-dependent oxidoreductase [Pelagicoccus sp. SDUM812005]
MFGKKSVETLVVGAGPCGMIAALALADGGDDVTILDSAPRSCTSSQATILHPETLAVLQRLGIAHRIIEAGYPIQKVSIYDELSHRQSVRLDLHPYAFPFALSIPQFELEAILEDELGEAGIHVLWNHRVSEYEADGSALHITADRYSDRGTGYAISHMERVIVKSIHFQAKTLVAADGYNSILRRVAGLETHKLGESQYFVSFEFETDRDPDHTCFLSIKKGLSTGQQPIAEGIARLQFQYSGLTLPSRNREKEREFLQDPNELPDYLDEEHFNQLVKERVPWNIGYVNKLRDRAAVPYEKRYLKTPRSGNVFFLGDSARSFSPLGSLGLNLGIQEAEQLAQTLLRTEEDEPRVRHQQLDELGRQMIANWKRLTQLHGSSIPSDSADPWVAKNRARLLRALPASGETLEELARQLHIAIELPHSHGALV